jgi:hypothetical protein
MPAVRSLAVGMAVLAGCDGGRTANGGDAAASCSADSTITVAGALTGTRTAPPAAATWTTADDLGTVQTSVLSGGPFISTWSFLFDGSVQATLPPKADATTTGTVTLAASF